MRSGEKDVVRLDIAMNYAEGVRVGERVSDRRPDLRDSCLLEAQAGAASAVEVGSVDELVNQNQRVRQFDQLEERDDRWMVEVGSDPGLAPHAGDSPVAIDDLDRDAPAETAVARRENETGAAPADKPLEAIAPVWRQRVADGEARTSTAPIRLCSPARSVTFPASHTPGTCPVVRSSASTNTVPVMRGQ